MYTKRDKVGPNGQAIGSITTDPREVDQIATRAWQTIYNGNFDDLKGAANAFMNKYKQYIYSSKEFKVQPITGKAFMRTCTSGKMTTAGLDNWEPAELAMLSESTFDWIAEMLNLIEAGRPWPDGMLHAKAAYLVKDPKRTDDPLAYRVLMVLPAVNRRWGTHRLQDLQPWTEKFAMNEIYAGIGNQGAEDAWYSMAIQFGYLKLNGTQYTSSNDV